MATAARSKRPLIRKKPCMSKPLGSFDFYDNIALIEWSRRNQGTHTVHQALVTQDFAPPPPHQGMPVFPASPLNFIRSRAHSRGADAQNLALSHQPDQCHDYDMSAVQRQSSELRDAYAALTRRRIVAAFVESLEDETSDDVSMAVIARRANVAERTIYRHFKTRAELLAAAGEWIENNVFGYVPFTSPDELPGIFRRLCRSFDRHPHLARAIALTRAGRTVRAGFRKRLIEHHREAMAPLTRRLRPKQDRQAEALANDLPTVLAG